jgi:hypothetical protein
MIRGNISHMGPSVSSQWVPPASVFWDMMPGSATAFSEDSDEQTASYQSKILFAFLSRSTVLPIHLNLDSFDHNGVRWRVKVLKLLIYSGLVICCYGERDIIGESCFLWQMMKAFELRFMFNDAASEWHGIMTRLRTFYFVCWVAAASGRRLEGWWNCIVRSFINFTLHLGLSIRGRLR